MKKRAAEYYFRQRKNGAVVFHVNKNTADQRIEMKQIAVINQKGQIKPHGQYRLTQTDEHAIADWLKSGLTNSSAGQDDIVSQAITALNHTASWAQKDATGEELDARTEDLLMAMNDLRHVLVRKRSLRLPKD